jgi:hypothetical protein
VCTKGVRVDQAIKTTACHHVKEQHMKNGKIQQVVTGWPGDEQASRLEQAIVQALDAATESAQSAARIRK